MAGDTIRDEPHPLGKTLRAFADMGASHAFAIN